MCSADLYAYLRKEFLNLDAFYNVDISYIKTITGIDNKIIFLCKQDKSRMKTTNFISPPNKRLDLQDIDVNLTGSPLKDDCEIDMIDMSIDSKLATANSWSEAEETYIGIQLDIAREILSNIALQKSLKFGPEYMPVWVLCDPPKEDNTILLQINLNSDLNSRGLIQYRGLVEPENINIKNIVAEHSSYFKGNMIFDISFDNIFNIKSNIVLKISWTSSSSLKPALTSLKDADVVLYQTIRIEENYSVAEDYWRQLNILSIIKDNIVDYKENRDTTKEPNYEFGSNRDIEDIQEKINTLMTQVSNFFEDESNSDRCDLETVIQRAKTRRYFDITDLLWDVLKCCSCYKDLKAAFATVFQCAAKFNVVNMPTNQNHLAEIIREVSQQRLAIPCLTGSEPLELLLEIGLGKLSKDYEYIFTESKICGANDLRIHKRDNISKTDDVGLNIRKSLHNAVIPISSDKAIERKTLLHGNNRQASTKNDCVGFQNSRFCKVDTEYKLSRLGQIHMTLEHLLLMQINLNIDIAYNQICAELLKKPTISFDKLRNEIVDKLEIPIVTDKILHKLEKKDPHARRISMISNNKFRKVQTTFYFSLDNIFPQNIFSNIVTDEKEMVRENLYHHWIYNHYSTNRS